LLTRKNTKEPAITPKGSEAIDATTGVELRFHQVLQPVPIDATAANAM
jgi:hypothetical protein